MRRFGLLAGGLLLILVIGCGGGEKPGAPAAAKSSPPPPLEPSIISIPIEVPLSVVTRQVEKKVPKVLKEKGYEGEPEGVKYSVRRGSISFSAKGNVITTTVPVSFTAEMKPGAGKSKGRGGRLGRRRADRPARLSCEASLNMTFTTRLEIGADWLLKTKTQAGQRKWTKPCEMTRLHIDVTKKIDEGLDEKVREIAATLDQKLANAGNIKGKVNSAWEMLQKPNSMEGGFWMIMQPERMFMGPFDGRGKSLFTTASIMAYPKIVASEEPPRVEKKPLPRNSREVAGDGYHIALEAVLPFEEATRMAGERLVGKEFDVSGQKVKVTGARIYGNGDNLVVEAALTGPVDVTVYLTGKPHYDSSSGELSVRNLDFTLETQNVLAKAANWLLHGTLQQKIAEKAVFSLGDQLEKAKESLEERINKPVGKTATLQGTADKLELQGVYVVGDAFKVIVIAEGKMSLTVK